MRDLEGDTGRSGSASFEYHVRRPRLALDTPVALGERSGRHLGAAGAAS